MSHDTPPLNRRFARNADLTISTRYRDGSKPTEESDLPWLQVPDGWPLMRRTGSTTDWRTVFSANVRRWFVEAGHNVTHQGIGVEVASMRADTYNRLMEWRSRSIPNSRLVTHKLIKAVKLCQTSTSDGKRYGWDAPAQVGFEAAMVRAGNGEYLRAEGGTDGLWGQVNAPLQFGDPYGPVIGQMIAEDWGDADEGRTGEYSCLDAPIYMGWMSDSIPDLNNDRYGNQLAAVTVRAILADGEIEVDRLPFTEGTDLGDGWFELPAEYYREATGEPPALWIKGDLTLATPESTSGYITGFRHVSATRSQIRWNTSKVLFGNYGSVGQTAYVFNGNRSFYEADWDNDGVDEPRTDPVLARVRAIKALEHFRAHADAWEAVAGWRCPIQVNWVNALHSGMRNGWNNFGSSNPFFGEFDFPVYENAGTSFGFYKYDGTGIFWRNLATRDPEDMIKGIMAGRLALKREVLRQFPNGGPQVYGSAEEIYPWLILDWELGGPSQAIGDTSDTDYTTLGYDTDPLFHQFACFALCVTMSQSHCGCSINGENMNKDPWGVVEQFIYPGNPIDFAAWEQGLGSFDPDAYTIVMRTPDFGTAGYFTFFENVVYVLNLENPGQGYMPVSDGTFGTTFGAALQAASQAIDGKSCYWPDHNNYVYQGPEALADPSHKLHNVKPGLVPGMIRNPTLCNGSLVSDSAAMPGLNGHVFMRY